MVGDADDDDDDNNAGQHSTITIGRHIDNQWWDAGVVVCLGQSADLHMAQLIPLPLTVFCSSKSRLV